MTKKLYLVETVSIFRMRYVVEAREAEHANEEFIMNKDNITEFSQHHVDECITSTREISSEEFIELFDTDNDYCKSWHDYQKYNCINKIDYNK
jgi:hypothetical protein